jgi:hypothetical protein
MEGRTNNMNTHDREEIQNKLNPTMFRSLFIKTSSEDYIPKCADNFISEIKEEEDESDSYGHEQIEDDNDEDDDYEEISDIESPDFRKYEDFKINQSISKNQCFHHGIRHIEDEDNEDDECDDVNEGEVDDEDIHEGFEVSAQIGSY